MGQRQRGHGTHTYLNHACHMGGLILQSERYGAAEGVDDLTSVVCHLPSHLDLVRVWLKSAELSERTRGIPLAPRSRPSGAHLR